MISQLGIREVVRSNGTTFHLLERRIRVTVDEQFYAFGIGDSHLVGCCCNFNISSSKMLPLHCLTKIDPLTGPMKIRQFSHSST